MSDFRYRIVDVFTTRPLEGNALAVFPDAAAMSPTMMQSVARELNLAETAFVLPPERGGAARVRIFTPTKEMLFAGHPTIGTSYVLTDEGRLPVGTSDFVLEEEIGPVPVRVEDMEGEARRMFWLRTPPIAWKQQYDRAVCASVLGLALDDLLDIVPQRLTAGNPTIFIAARSREAVDRAWLDMAGMRQLRDGEEELSCVFVFTPTAEGAYSRMFAPEYGIVEDPATGSSTGPLAAYMMRHGLVSAADGTRFVSEQGTKMGRRSLLHVHIFGDGGEDGIDVGGAVVSLAEGTMHLPDPRGM